MASERQQSDPPEAEQIQDVIFSGDGVQLAGQINYPTAPTQPGEFPVIFIIQHATCTSRKAYGHLARIAVAHDMAIFLWDKRGTGASGSAGNGSVLVDTLKAYETALSQPGIDRQRAIIVAQNEGSLLLGDAFDDFSTIQPPLGVLLIGNMLDEDAITVIDRPAHIVMSKNDWNAWQTYARDAAAAHSRIGGYPTQYYVAPNTNRRLMYNSGGSFHNGAAHSISEWLDTLCPPSV